MKRKLTAILLATLLFVTVLSGCGSKSETPAPTDGQQTEQPTDQQPTEARTLRLSMPVPEGTDTYNEAVAAKEYIEEHTNGSLKIDLYPANTLGDWTQVFDELMMGSIDMAISNVPETYNPILGITALSYLTYDYDSCRQYFSPDSFLTGAVGGALEELGIHFFGFSFSGFDGVGSRNELKAPAEIGVDKDCLIRVPSLDAVKLPLEYLGFRTSTIPYTDTYSSIQTGVVDGWIGAPAYQHYLGFRDVENYYYAYNSLQEAFAIMISKSTWDTLTADEQKAVTEGMELAASMSIDDAEKGDEEYMKMLEEAGITVVRFDHDQLAAFAKAVEENVWPRFEKDYGKEFMDQLLASRK